MCDCVPSYQTPLLSHRGLWLILEVSRDSSLEPVVLSGGRGCPDQRGSISGWTRDIAEPLLSMEAPDKVGVWKLSFHYMRREGFGL